MSFLFQPIMENPKKRKKFAPAKEGEQRSEKNKTISYRQDSSCDEPDESEVVGEDDESSEDAHGSIDVDQLQEEEAVTFGEPVFESGDQEHGEIESDGTTKQFTPSMTPIIKEYSSIGTVMSMRTSMIQTIRITRL